MLLPDPQRRGEIHFVFAKSMAYGKRIVLIGLFLLSGFAVQILLLEKSANTALFLGGFLLFVASMLGVVKGYTNNPGNIGNKREWREGNKEQLERILVVAEKTKAWDQSSVDISCGIGCFTFFAIAGSMSLLVIVMAAAGRETLALMLTVDAVVLLLPQWVTGIRRILVNAPLTIKVQNLLHVYSVWEATKKDGEQMLVQMEVIKGDKGEMPADAKLILQFPALGESFYGVQTQVVLNNVQGADFSYMYCVIVAKTGFGIREKLKSVRADADACSNAGKTGFWSFLKKPPGILTEWKEDGGMDILVIRQQTTKEDGYYTDPAAEERIFNFARAQVYKLEVPSTAK